VRDDSGVLWRTATLFCGMGDRGLSGVGVSVGESGSCEDVSGLFSIRRGAWEAGSGTNISGRKVVSKYLE